MDWEPRIGMKVVCYNNEGAPMLSKGATYTLSGVYEPGGYSEYLGVADFGVFLHEVDIPSHRDAFHPGRFKPLRERKTDISIFTAMLDHTPKELIPASYTMPGRAFE